MPDSFLYLAAIAAMRKIIYIINPISGTKKKESLHRLIEKKTTEKNIPYRILPSVANGDYSFLLATIKEEKITDIVIAGGDGTVSQVVSSLMGLNLNFGIIPCGSGNGLAYAAGIPRQPSKALDIVFNGNPVAIDGFYINKQFSCMLCGLGFDAKVAHEFAAQPRRGLSTYARLVTKNFLNARTYPFVIKNGSASFSCEAYFISIANSNQFGNHVTIAPKAVLSDGLLDIVIVKKTNKPLLLFNLIRQVLSGKPAKTEKSFSRPVVYFQAKEITIENKEKAPLHIDGDPVETLSKLHIEVIKSCFRLYQP